MPDRVFIASPEIKEQPKADESEETGGQCRVFVAVSGFDRQAARPCAEVIAEIEGDLDAGGTQHFTAFCVADQQQLLG